jgi:hypothetical protein
MTTQPVTVAAIARGELRRRQADLAVLGADVAWPEEVPDSAPAAAEGDAGRLCALDDLTDQATEGHLAGGDGGA